MEKCACDQHGYCEYFRQEMTYNPPNWQWCQGATEEERKKYKIDCDKKHDRKKFILDGKYVTNQQLVKDCVDFLIPKIARLNVKGIAAVPRSGFLPASFCSVMLNLPLFLIDEDGSVKPMSALSEFGGKRMEKHKQEDGKILVLDDTVYSGNSLLPIKNHVGKEDFLFGTLYVHPSSVGLVDVYGKELPPPHLLEWNFFNSCYVSQCLLDFDGILSPNVPYEICIDEERYIEYIKNVEPYYHRLPRIHSCKGIVTARLEKYRDVTEEWLEKHKVKYEFLRMFPTERQEERDANHAVEAAKFKSDVLREVDAHFFMESEKLEAQLMRSQSKRLIICPEEGSFR
jgi:adenine/guanine phosphoribosyltransferase-like PRPP-binding protein/uncharacterized HAD superfamily protein